MLEELPDWTWGRGELSGRRTWDEWYELLERYVARERNAAIPESHTEDGIYLGKWARNQRVRKRSGQITEEQTAKLERLPGWAWNPKRSGNPG
jgi:hypothetical protein